METEHVFWGNVVANETLDLAWEPLATVGASVTEPTVPRSGAAGTQPVEQPRQLDALAATIRADSAEDPVTYLLRSDTGHDGE